jgi:hypothetical protein
LCVAVDWEGFARVVAFFRWLSARAAHTSAKLQIKTKNQFFCFSCLMLAIHVKPRSSAIVNCYALFELLASVLGVDLKNGH